MYTAQQKSNEYRSYCMQSPKHTKAKQASKQKKKNCYKDFQKQKKQA